MNFPLAVHKPLVYIGLSDGVRDNNNNKSKCY